MSRTYKIPGINIEYDADLYRAYVQDVRDAVKEIEQLPKEYRDDARRLLRKAIRGVYLATRQLYDPLIDQKKMEIVESKSSDYLTDIEDLESKCHGDFFVD